MAIAFRSKALWLVSTAMAVWTPAAQAQQSERGPSASAQAGGDDRYDDDIVVTAQKRTQNLIDVPQSISVVPGTLLEQRHATSLVDYAALVPGLSIQQQNA